MHNATDSTNCSALKGSETILIVGGSIGAASIPVCLLPIVLVFILKLHRQFTYRVALYQVLAALMYECALVLSSFTPFSNDDYYNRPSENVQYPLCQFTGFILQFLFWLKLLFVSFIVIHLFTFAIMHKNIKKVEVCYIGFSVTVALVVAIIPFLSQTYGPAGSWCWITSWRGDCPSEILLTGLIEQFALYYGPGLLLLLVDSILALGLILILVARLCKKGTGRVEDSYKRQQSKALKQMVPLLVYSITFLLLLLPGFANRVYGATPHHPLPELTLSSIVCIASWGWAAGLTLLAHIFVMVWSKRRLNHKVETMVINSYGTTGAATAPVGHFSVNYFPRDSATHYSLENESDVDEEKFSFVQ